MNPAVAQAINALLNDIEAMQSGDAWFGEFSEYNIDFAEVTASVEWPNLAISARNLRELLDEQVTGGSNGG
jgi:hypothetical protein